MPPRFNGPVQLRSGIVIGSYEDGRMVQWQEVEVAVAGHIDNTGGTKHPRTVWMWVAVPGPDYHAIFEEPDAAIED